MYVYVVLPEGGGGGGSRSLASTQANVLVTCVSGFDTALSFVISRLNLKLSLMLSLLCTLCEDL